MSGSANLVRADSRTAILVWSVAAGLIAAALGPLTTAWTQAQDLGHGWAVPLLVGYLWWSRWDERPALVARAGMGMGWWWAAALLILLALSMRLLLTPFPLWPMAIAIYLAVLAGIVLGGAWLAAGRAGVRWLGGPLIVVVGALPWPSLLEVKIVGPMREMLATVAAEVSYLFGVSAMAAGTTLRLAHTWVGVDETCGGMRSLQASVMAALFLGEWLRLAWRRRIGLVAVGIFAAVLGNFLRILLLVWRASVGGEEALHAIHDVAGWIALAVSLGLTGFAAGKMRGAPATAAATTTATLSTASVAWPRVALMWVTILVVALGAVEAGTRWWYWRGEMRQAATVPQWSVRFPSNGADFHAVPPSEAAREMLRPDAFAAGEWQDENSRATAAYYVEWRHGQAAHSIPFLHNPTICLPMSGCELVRPIGLLPIRWTGGEIPFRAYMFRRNGEEFAVGFTIWDPSRGRSLETRSAGYWGWIISRVSHVFEARADQPAQLLSVAVWGEHSEDRLAGTITTLITGQ